MNKLPINYKKQLDRFLEENTFCSSDEFEKGKYLYLFMVDFDDIPKCFGVGYTIKYALKKGMCNTKGCIKTDIKVTRPRINKVRIGDTKKMDTFDLDNLIKYHDKSNSFVYYYDTNTVKDKHGIYRVANIESFSKYV